METKETVKGQTSVEQLKANFNTTMANITQTIAEKKYKVTADGQGVDHVEYLLPNVDHLTLTGRKKLAKKLHYMQKRKGLKSLNQFFSYLQYRGIITEKIRFTVSDKEAEIQKLRKVYKDLAAQTETARLAYKEAKGDFYKS